MTIRLLIAEDRGEIRESLRRAFRETDVTIVAEAADGCEAIRLADDESFDVALLSVSLPRADGFRVLNHLRKFHSDRQALMHPVDASPTMVEGCRRLGARGFVQQGSERHELLAAVRAVHAGAEVWGANPNR